MKFLFPKDVEEWKARMEQSKILDRVADLFVVTEGIKEVGTVTEIIGYLRDVDGHKMEMRCSWQRVENNEEYKCTAA